MFSVSYILDRTYYLLVFAVDEIVRNVTCAAHFVDIMTRR
jgi:hypothetical protein